jgi:phosphohistidine phosphatase
VVETLGEVELGLGAKLGAEYDRGVYLASAEALLERVQSAGEAVDAFLLVGHNPGLEMLALALGASSPLRTELAVKYPTATLVELTFPVERWAEVAKASGTITRLIRPRDLDPDLGPDEDS